MFWGGLLIPDTARSVRLDASQVAVWDPQGWTIPAPTEWERIPSNVFRSTTTLNLGRYRPPLLLRIALQAPRPGRWWLTSELRTPEHLHLRLGSRDLGDHGTGEPFGRRVSKSLFLSIPLDLSGRDTLWVLASDPQGDCKLEMDLVPDAAFPATLQWSALKTGLFLGCVGMICVAALYLWGIVRQRAFGWYAALAILGWLWIAVKCGLPSAWLWSDSPQWNRVAPGLLSWCSVGAFGFFVIHLLELRRHLPRFSRLLTFLSGAQFAVGLSMLLSVAAPALHARLHGTVDLDSAQVAHIVLLAVAIALRVRARDPMAVRLSLSISPLLAAFLLGAVMDLSSLRIDRDFDCDLISVAALVQGTLTTFVLAREVQRRERRGRELARDFHLRLVDRTDEHDKAVAYELHDDLGQRAAALRLQSAKLFSGDDLSDAQREVGVRFGELVERIRDLSHRLQPPPHSVSSLAEALAELCRDLESSSGIDILLRVQGKAEPAGEVSQQLLRIVQEALSNAIRHGRPSTIEVELGLDPRKIRMSVRDDGRGFLTDSVKNGLGMRSMRDRARAIGADLSVESRPGGPTRVRLGLSRRSDGSAEV